MYMAPPFTGGCKVQKARHALGFVGVAFFLPGFEVVFFFLSGNSDPSLNSFNTMQFTEV